MKKEINEIFNIVKNKQEVICLPDQVFANPDFEYLLTIGGDLVEDEKEYEKFIQTLKSIGETEFYIYENLGAMVTDRKEPFQLTIHTTDNYKTFQRKVQSFDPPFGWHINNFFVYGKNINWGIYIAEFPTINIIGCNKNLSERFRQTFSIQGNGYTDLKDFITKEFSKKPEYLKEIVKNYKLE